MTAQKLGRLEGAETLRLWSLRRTISEETLGVADALPVESKRCRAITRDSLMILYGLTKLCSSPLINCKVGKHVPIRFRGESTEDPYYSRRR